MKDKCSETGDEESREGALLLQNMDDSSWLDPELGDDESKEVVLVLPVTEEILHPWSQTGCCTNKDQFSISYQQFSRLLSVLKMMKPGLF